MQNQQIFQDQTEIARLAVQNRLLSAYESGAVEQIFAAGSNWSVLDIGCNDGLKTVHRFSNPAITHVVGLEYNPNLAKDAQSRYGNEKFSFHACDVENAVFSEQLRETCSQRGIEGFDVIYLSFVLMHLRQPEQLLRRLKPFLKDSGCLLIIEPNDRASRLEPDPEGLLTAFLDILEQDKYAGNRRTGADLIPMLREAGYRNEKIWQEAIGAEAGEREKKQDIFQTFFSYLPEDVVLLRQSEPEDGRYLAWEQWLRQNFENLRQAVTQDAAHIHMGVRMISCRKGEA